MKIIDISKAISKVLSSKLNIKVFPEWEEKAERPSLYIQCIDINKTYSTQGYILLKVSWDIHYIPKKINDSANVEILEMLDNIDLAFDHYGKKYLKVLDRAITLNNVTSRIVDNRGHYLFDTELNVPYGEIKEYELMQNLELRQGGSNE